MFCALQSTNESCRGKPLSPKDHGAPFSCVHAKKERSSVALERRETPRATSNRYHHGIDISRNGSDPIQRGGGTGNVGEQRGGGTGSVGESYAFIVTSTLVDLLTAKESLSSTIETA
jgi:hypothetical protein